MAKLESFAYAGEVSDDSVGGAAAIQHGDHGYVIAVSQVRFGRLTVSHIL